MESSFDIPLPLIEALKKAKRVTVLTGAGISAESGIPTFRDAQTGLWAKYQPEELATPQAFLKNPKLVWDWYAWRRELCAKSNPNPGHYALVALAKKLPTTLITQNVDGLHDRAGSQGVIELHGNIYRTKCFDEDQVVTSWEDKGQTPPHCPRCSVGLLRPDVVWFGEVLPSEALQLADQGSRECDVFLSIGTSSVVEPAASLPLRAANQGATLIEINLVPTPLSQRADFLLRAPAGKILPLILQAVWPD